MADNKVKISNILENQLPEFILDENPLFKEFLEQYYLSQEHEYGTVDLAEKIDDLREIDSFTKLKFSETAPKLTKFVGNIDDVIEVDNHVGFIPKDGLVKVGNEIFTYTGKSSFSQEVAEFDSSANTIKLTSTIGLDSFRAQTIIFDKAFSNVVAGKVYFVNEVKDSNTITISEEENSVGDVFDLNDENPLPKDATANISTGIAATAVCSPSNIKNGILTGRASLNDGGSAYSSAPIITVEGGGGTGGTAVATIFDGKVTDIVLSGGSGYTSEPTLTIANPTGVIVNIQSGGVGYDPNKTYTVSVSGGKVVGDGFNGTLEISSGGEVTGIKVINHGNYSDFTDTVAVIPSHGATFPTATNFAFTGCIRGFSGIDDVSSGEFLNFNVSEASFHNAGATLTNLGLVFLAEFYRKYKTQFLPGFEERQFQNVNIDNILSRARDFYSSKGTDSSLKILFSVLFGKYVEIKKPFVNTIQASTSDWSLSDIIVVEPIEGDPGKLEATTVLQDSFTTPTAKATVARIQEIFVKNKRFYKIFFTRGSVENTILTSKKTKVLGMGVTDTTLTVDSTLGFPESGSFFNIGSEGTYNEVTYEYKNANQFFNCVGLSPTLAQGDSIIDSTFLYGYEENDTQRPVQMRVVGTLVGLAKNSDTSSQFAVGDRLSIKHLGEKVEETDPRFNSWFYNNVTITNIERNISTNSFITEVDHYLHVDDRVDVLVKDTRVVDLENVRVSSVISRTQFGLATDVSDINKEYVIRKRLDFASTNLNDEGALSNIQNTFVDKDKNTYVAFTGLPGYDSVEISDRSKTYDNSNVNDSENSINILSHGFLSGEGVYHETISGTIGVTTATYFVHKIDSNNIHLSVSRADVSNNQFIGISTSNIGNFKLTPSSIYGKNLVTQNNFKRILKTPKPGKSYKEITGAIGVALNGLELYSPVSEDSIFFGQIDHVNVLNVGTGYDVVNPPDISVTDSNGTGASVIGNFTGKIEDIVITNKGFNYTDTPVVTISGGNGTEATAEARMRGLTYEVSFNDFDVNFNADLVTISDGHRFLDGEEVTYVATGTPIGIGSTAVGFGTDRLTSGGSYFLKKVSDTEFQIHPSLNDFRVGINTVDFNATGNRQHTFRSKMIRTVIDRIVVTDSTDDFSSKKVIVDSQAWPPLKKRDIYSSFVGINTADNYIYARNHTFKNGDNVVYSFDGTAIGGLTANSNYKVTVLDNHRFLLSDAPNESSTNYDRKIYKDLTSVGVGTHTFKYPEISVTINGTVSVGDTTTIPSYYVATANPSVKGTLDSVFIRNGGSGYGVSDMINFQKSPRVEVKTGKNAEIRVIISGGKISSAFIANTGSEYTSPPTINVVGEGRLGQLTATIVDGKISTVTIVNPGSGYKEGTTVEIIPTGANARLNAEVHEWKINNVERYSTQLGITLNRDMVQIKAPVSIDENRLVGFYPGKKYRSILDDNVKETGGNIVELDPVDDASQFKHSPIIGWAYDGNPIYGPYGNSNAFKVNGSLGGIIRLTSSYVKDVEPNSQLRPTGDGITEGYFSQDWLYNASSGLLDEFNGRFCQTPEFPEGTYAYFSPITNSNSVAYPYITNAHYNESDSFNYDLLVDQSDSYMNNGLYKRNVTHLGLNDASREYPFLQETLDSKTRIDVDHVKGAKIDSITVENPGIDYKVGQQVNLSEDTVDAEIKEILGKPIQSITTTETDFENTVFSVNNKVVTGITTLPHGFLDTDIIEVTGISSASYKNIEGFRTVGVSTVNTQLSVAIPAIATSGVTTDIQLSDTTVTRKFVPGDIIQIGNEQMLIANVDDVNNKYKVTRQYNGTTAGTHNADALVTKLPVQFTFAIDSKLENKNIAFAHKQNFGVNVIGIGSTATNIVIGKQGDKDINVSIPPKSIYLPGHKFKTGEQLNLVSVGGTINASTTASLSNPFDLADVDLFAIRVGTDFLGIATSKAFAGITSSIFFVANNLEGNDHTLSQLKNNITGIVKKVNAKVVLDSAHSMKVGDEVKLDITTSGTQTFVFKYNEQLKKLVVDPQTFANTAVTTSTDEITIVDHGLSTGDIVVYTNAVGVATPLQDNREYYVIKINDDKIKLADSMYSATSFPYENVNITEQGHGTHEISLVNPKLEVINNSQLIIDVTDSSLLNYDINFYTDNEFKSRYESSGITTAGTPIIDSYNIKVDENLPKNLFYRVEGKNKDNTDTYPSSVNEFVNNYSNISIVDSKFNQSYKLTSVGSTTFDFTLVGAAETTTYDSTGFSSAFYSTTSKNDFGGIHSIDIINPGDSVRKLPIVTSIGSTTGRNAILTVSGSEIGEIVDTTIVDTGIEFLEDSTLTPKVDTNVILNLRNTLTLQSIGVTTTGSNYTAPPKVIAVGNPKIVTRTSLQGSSVFEVDILENDSNLNENLRIIATNNSNGVRVINAVSNNQLNTLSLKSPQGPGINGFGNNFPFEIGDKIFVENIQITDNADGYNSSDYDFQFFEVTDRNTVSGVESITYSIVGLGTTGGAYNASKNASFGRVIKATDLATFTPVFDTIDFAEAEKVVLDSDPSVFGIVSRNGYNSEDQTLKLETISGEFKNGDIIRGTVGNFRATISSITEFDFDAKVGSMSQDYGIWQDDIGKLNFDLQRLHDNDYYQRFSYAIRGEVPLQTWKEAVDSLGHASGFKNFSDYEIITYPPAGIRKGESESDINLDLELNSIASVHCRLFYDSASEDTDTTGLSNLIIFENKDITDYNESRTNKVLMIDDISSQFTGASNSSGQLVGLSEFPLFTGNETLLYHTINPVTGINTNTGIITINDHNFNTGERLTYDPTNNAQQNNNGTHLGIVTTSSVAIGVAATDLLPEEVFAIRIDENQFKVAIGRSEAEAGVGVTFVNAVGIGTTHSFATESELATTRTIISIDNIIQSPLARKDVSVGLTTAVGIGSTQINVNDTSNIQGNTLVRINQEIFKVTQVGVGATNALNVLRGQMGTVAAAHTVGAATSVMSGDYRINHGKIYFSDPPYGPAGIGTLTTKSTFSGRVFYKLNYSSNLIMDDVSEEFGDRIGNNLKTEFPIKSNGVQASGINTSFGAVLIDNIFQKPFYGDVGSLSESDYRIIGTGETISFTGSRREDLPKGGIINEFSVGVGSNYQVPRRAIGVAIVNGSGNVTNVNIGGTGGEGAGYLFPPNVSIADTLGNGTGAAVTATVGAAGTITGFTVNGGGTNYTQASPPLVFVDAPSPYKNLNMTGGSGVGAKMDVVVGTGGSIVDFKIADRGIGYKVGDVLSLEGLPFNPVGVGSTAFQITVVNKYQDKFAGWTFGQLIELDDFSLQFNGARTSFLITRTTTETDFYSIVAKEGSGIIIANNLLIFLNDVLQKPGLDYEFNGGTRITFKEAPKAGSKFKMYLYTGSDEDYLSIEVEQSIKPGDKLRLQRQDNFPSQDQRIIYEMIASDTVETETYSGVGINTDPNFKRPVEWCKQTFDIIIDGKIISKHRSYLEPDYFPSSNIIAPVSPTDTKIYINNAWNFSRVDNLPQGRNDVRIVGLGTTAVVEKFEEVTYGGDYGIITGIKTSTTGINTTSPMIQFVLKPDPEILGSGTNKVTKPGIVAGDIFAIRNTHLGAGVTSIDDHVDNVICTSPIFADNVYKAHQVVAIGSSEVLVSCNVNSVAGIVTAIQSDLYSHGEYSFGIINTGARPIGGGLSFTFHNTNGIAGIETSAHVSRTEEFRLSY